MARFLTLSLSQTVKGIRDTVRERGVLLAAPRTSQATGHGTRGLTHQLFAKSESSCCLIALLSPGVAK